MTILVPLLALTAIISPPATAMERPERVHVLPVLWIPQEQVGAVPRGEMYKATHNLAIFLRTAQVKFQYMLRNKTTGAFRGTFGLATWDASYNVVREYNPLANTLEPVVIPSPTKWSDLPTTVDEDGNVVVKTEQVVSETLDAVGCKAQSCPFVFVIMIAQPDDGPFAAIPFNYGFNGGGGYVRVGMWRFAAAASLGTSVQSSLLHELGHTFGLRHMSTYDGGDYGVDHALPPGCTEVSSCPVSAYQAYCPTLPIERRRLEFHCSPSIMSYSKLNGTAGCQGWANDGLCSMPADWSTIDTAIPGELVAENLHNLALNALVFPELAADYDLLADDDNDDDQVEWHTAFAGPDGTPFPGHPRLKVWSAHTKSSSEHRASFGYHSKPIEPAYTSYDGRRNWHSVDRGPDGWTYLDFTFPEPVVLSRVRAYSGYGHGTHAATEIEVHKGGALWQVPCGNDEFYGRVDGETDVLSWGSCAGGKTHYRIWLRAGSSGHVVLRGLRFWDELGNELQAPRMPIATSSYGHTGTWASSPQNVVGWDQLINGYWHGFDADQMWHSKDVGANNWVSIDVRLPNLTLLSAMAIYTGHSNLYNPATRVQIEYRNAQGTYVALTNVAVGPYAMVQFPPTRATHLRIAFRSGASGHVVVRGIRMFNGYGELYTPTFEYEGFGPPLD